MRTVRIERQQFIEHVARNRNDHRGAFDKALEGYRSRLHEELERRLEDLKAGRRVDQSIRLPEPQDHTGDYDRILTMARMSVDEVLELTQDDFGMYVMDQWHWKGAFTETADWYSA